MVPDGEQDRCVKRSTDREDLASLAEIVRAYIAAYRSSAEQELQFFARQATFRDAIEMAGLAKTASGKRHSHQWRLREETLEQARDNLGIADLQSTRSFAQLKRAIERAVGRIDGIGSLTVYDTALRLGAFLGLEPDVVYLHAGTRVGASALGLKTDREWIEIESLPQELRQLKAREVEDLLCIYKEQLDRLRSRRPARTVRGPDAE